MKPVLRQWMLSQSYCFLQYQKLDKACALLEALEVLDPENPDIHRMLAYTYLQQGRTEDCIKSADKFRSCAGPKDDMRTIDLISKRARYKARQKGEEQSQAEVKTKVKA
ncbi:tetratricopeptide repeat protein [Spongorhabdus nitratireducens]